MTSATQNRGSTDNPTGYAVIDVDRDKIAHEHSPDGRGVCAVDFNKTDPGWVAARADLRNRKLGTTQYQVGTIVIRRDQEDST